MIRKTLIELRTGAKGTKHVPLIFAAIASAVLILIVFVGFMIYLPYDQLVNGPKAAETLKDLEKEFKMIAPLPNAVEVRYGSMHKTHQGHVGSDYKTDESYEGIRAHYDSELRRHGWTFVKERPVAIWWRDYGGQEAFYCKGLYTGTLQYSGREEQEVGWTFNFSLSWGLFDECK